jgi:hypothetical protein
MVPESLYINYFCIIYIFYALFNQDSKTVYFKYIPYLTEMATSFIHFYSNSSQFPNSCYQVRYPVSFLSSTTFNM